MKEDNKNWWRPAVLIFTEISTWIAVPIILALILGEKLDQHYGTKPWIFLSLAVFGFLVSSYGIIKAVKKFTNKTKEQEKNN